MEDEIRAGRAPGLHTFLPEATHRLGGFSDACHSLTAATTIAKKTAPAARKPAAKAAKKTTKK